FAVHCDLLSFPTDALPIFVNTPLPLFENFNDAVDIGSFFSATYKSLATDNPDDPAPSFYYPTCCLYDDDGNVQENSFWISETEEDRKSTRLNSSHVKISYA